MIETLTEKTTYYLINDKGKIISKEYSIEKIIETMDKFKKIDIELEMQHAILKKYKGNVTIDATEFEKDKTNYIELFKKLFPGDYE